MEFKQKVCFLFSFLLLVVASNTAAAIAPSPQPLLGGSPPVLEGYTPLQNLSDPYVIEVAKFALAEHNKQVDEKGHRLEFVKVVEGWFQVVAGMDYKLVIAAKPVHLPDYAAHNYLVVVYDRLWEHFRKLTTFKPLD